MKIHKNDKVKILSGKDAGKEGKVVFLYPKKGKVVVEGVNMVKRHVKPGAVSKEGGILSIERPISVSNVKLICDRCQKPVRLGYSIASGKKYRVCKKCGEVIGK